MQLKFVGGPTNIIISFPLTGLLVFLIHLQLIDLIEVTFVILLKRNIVKTKNNNFKQKKLRNIYMCYISNSSNYYPSKHGSFYV